MTENIETRDCVRIIQECDPLVTRRDLDPVLEMALAKNLRQVSTVVSDFQTVRQKVLGRHLDKNLERKERRKWQKEKLPPEQFPVHDYIKNLEAYEAELERLLEETHEIEIHKVPASLCPTVHLKFLLDFMIEDDIKSAANGRAREHPARA